VRAIKPLLTRQLNEHVGSTVCHSCQSSVNLGHHHVERQLESGRLRTRIGQRQRDAIKALFRLTDVPGSTNRLEVTIASRSAARLLQQPSTETALS
jgi:hypothetical protein